MILFHDLTPADAPALADFYDTHYVREFPDPDERESLATMIDYLRLKEKGWYGRNNYHIILATTDGTTIGLSVVDYFAEPNAGVIEFLMVVPDARGSGAGRALLAETERVLDQDAAAASGKRLDHLFAEINDPFIPTEVPDTLDPAVRAVIWDRWGFRGLDLPYLQPALSETQDGVTNLLLIGKSSGAPPCPSTVRQAVHDYLRWAMRIEDPSRCPEYRTMAEHLSGQDAVRTFSLSRYVGSGSPHVTPLTGQDDPDWDSALALYRQVFGSTAYSVPESEFTRAHPVPFHFWSLRRTPSDPVAGMASFFTLKTAGFGGYVVFAEGLRGIGALRPLVARIELRMLADRPSVTGWYVEVADMTDPAPFHAIGFTELPVRYTTPDPEGVEVAIRLLYKPIGRHYRPALPTPAETDEAIREIRAVVYDR
ncbi:GNAT family N-acetyltransferase [Umezawaea sp. NPDC059074]|uniref:GNAT family N-acetyltransferase n=1 Tax=Umezawaea sp. NPDC059074 TaxID=3346716 RepID=UPI00367A4B70